MAEDLLDTVDRLQSRLQENPEPRKLLKTLRRLGELPMTVDILVETGVGKAVNSFRKHEVAGEVAKGLVAKWKKLVPQSADSHHKEAPRSHGHSRGPDPVDHRRTREPSPEDEPSYMEEEEEEEPRGYHTNYSPSPPPHEQYSPPQRGGYHSDEYESPEPEPDPEPSPPPPPPPPPPRKEVRHAKPSREPSKNHNHSHNSDKNRDREEERRQRHAQMSNDQGGGGKKRSADRERQQSPVQKSAKHNKKSSSHESKREEKKKGGEDGRPRVPKDSPSKEAEEDDFETPTMSFESFLTYDAPTAVKKKKKPSSSSSSSSHNRPSHSASSTSSSHRTPPPAPSSSSSSSSKASKANGTQSSKRSHSGSGSSAATPGKRKRVVEEVPTLPDIPLPAIQPNYRPLPSIDVTPLSPLRRKVPVYNDEEDAGFTGKRFNSKMVVYSGSKTAYLPKMMTLYEQCIRVLQNNIDSIAEVGGVPFEILEPVLERCTPEQLYRIEQSNQWFIEDSDELWMRHCQRDFKRQAPQEYESWREMYLRLHDEREEKLKLLTQNISSAHANKPKGRQVKMAYVNSAAKPPRDVRRRQEKFGTTSGSSSASTAAAAPIKIRPAISNYSAESGCSSSSQQDALPSSSRFSAGGGGGGGHAARDKPQVKKIAPMMAKTIKAFKNRFSRR